MSSSTIGKRKSRETGNSERKWSYDSKLLKFCSFFLDCPRSILATTWAMTLSLQLMPNNRPVLLQTSGHVSWASQGWSLLLQKSAACKHSASRILIHVNTNREASSRMMPNMCGWIGSDKASACSRTRFRLVLIFFFFSSGGTLVLSSADKRRPS